MRLRNALARGLLLLAACASPATLVSEQTYAPPGPSLERVAVIPFSAHRSYEASRRLGGVPPDVASEQVTRVVAEAMAERGIDVIASDEVAAAIENVPRLTLAVDALVFAEIAGRELGATGVLLGEVLRFRNARGASPAARRPASVAFQMSLFETPDAFKVWSARFDETQPADVDAGADSDADRPPEVWLSAADIARRGAASVARSLDSQR